MRRIIPLLLLLFILSACGTKIEQKQSVEVQETLESVTDKAYEVLMNTKVLQMQSNRQFTLNGEKTYDESIKATLQLEPYMFHYSNEDDIEDEHYITKEEWYKRVGNDGEWHLDTRVNASYYFGSYYLYNTHELEAESLKNILDVKDYVLFKDEEDGYHITLSSNDEEAIKTYLKLHLLQRHITTNDKGLNIKTITEKTVIDKETYEIISRNYTLNMYGKISENQREDAEMMFVMNVTDYKYTLDEELQIPVLAIEQAKATASKAQGVEIMREASGIFYAATSIRSESEVYVYMQDGSEVLETSFYMYNVQDFNPNFIGYMYYEDAETIEELQYDSKTVYYSEGDSEYWQEMEHEPSLLEKISLDLADALLEVETIADNLNLSESPDTYYINITVENHSENVLRYLMHSQDFQEIISVFGGVPSVDYLEENYEIDKETGEAYAMDGIYELSLDDKFLQIQYVATFEVNDVTEDDFYVIE